MAQRSHVPKFGNWDGDNVPYTAYFENARKDKVSGVRMNPNDPEENPEAFMFSGYINGNETSNNSPAPLLKSPDKPAASEKYHAEEPKQHYGHQRNTSDQQKSINQKSSTSESSSDKSNSDNANLHRNHRRKRFENKKSMSESSHGFFPPSTSPGRNRIRGGNDDLSYRSAASVPKFGAWDERDPKSGEGFTVIFNKVKEEKQIAAAKFPPVESQTSNRPEKQERNTKSNMFCCLF